MKELAQDHLVSEPEPGLGSEHTLSPQRRLEETCFKENREFELLCVKSFDLFEPQFHFL